MKNRVPLNFMVFLIILPIFKTQPRKKPFSATLPCWDPNDPDLSEDPGAPTTAAAVAAVAASEAAAAVAAADAADAVVDAVPCRRKGSKMGY